MVESSPDFRPTPERPLLLGLLVDVSGSMSSSIENNRGKGVNRLESFRDALEEMVKRAGELSQEGSNRKVAPLLKLFAYGFGFGNLLAAFFGGSGPAVRDLLQLPGARTSLIPLDRLTRDWSVYRAHVEGLARQMFGNTPMREGFQIAGKRFAQEHSTGTFSGRPVLFVLSDGEPTDASPAEVVQIATEIQRLGVMVVSCYVTSEDIAEPRRLYGRASSNWPSGAALMLECASPVPPDSPFTAYLMEYNWTVDPDGRLFTQINQSKVLSEFMNLVLSPLQERAPQATSSVAIPPALSRSKQMTDPIEIFFSYAHEDEDLMNDVRRQLAIYERRGRILKWHDRKIPPGTEWHGKIDERLHRARIVLLFVSPHFLDSDYCYEVEGEAALLRHDSRQVRVLPIILRPCSWEETPFSKLQALPRDGRPVTTWEDRDEACLDVARGVMAVVDGLIATDARTA